MKKSILLTVIMVFVVVPVLGDEAIGVCLECLEVEKPPVDAVVPAEVADGMPSYAKSVADFKRLHENACDLSLKDFVRQRNLGLLRIHEARLKEQIAEQKKKASQKENPEAKGGWIPGAARKVMDEKVSQLELVKTLIGRWERTPAMGPEQIFLEIGIKEIAAKELGSSMSKSMDVDPGAYQPIGKGRPLDGISEEQRAAHLRRAIQISRLEKTIGATETKRLLRKNNFDLSSDLGKDLERQSPWMKQDEALFRRDVTPILMSLRYADLERLPAHFQKRRETALQTQLKTNWPEACADVKQGLGSNDKAAALLKSADQLPEKLRAWTSGSYKVDNPGIAAFLKDLGITGTELQSSNRGRDRSDKYYSPRDQGDQSSCVSQALVADMESHDPKMPRLSADRLHKESVMMTDRLGGSDAGFAAWRATEREIAKDNGHFNETMGAAIAEKMKSVEAEVLNDKGEGADDAVVPEIALKTLEIRGARAAGIGPTDMSSPGVRPAGYTSVHWRDGTDAKFENAPAVDFNQVHLFKKLVDEGQEPVVNLDTESKVHNEDWARPVKGSVGHAVNVVGYDVGVSPFDLQEKSYFIVRDTFDGRSRHYNVAAEDLLPRVRGALKTKWKGWKNEND